MVDSVPPSHQRLGELCHADERPAGHIHGEQKTFLRAIHHAPCRSALGAKRDGVEADVELAPLLLDRLEHRLHRPSTWTLSGMKIEASTSLARGST
jgi:hypothetical protein